MGRQKVNIAKKANGDMSFAKINTFLQPGGRQSLATCPYRIMWGFGIYVVAFDFYLK